MKTWCFALTTLLASSAPALAADFLELKLNFDATEDYSLAERSKAVGTRSVSTSRIEVKGLIGGRKLEVVSDGQPEVTENSASLELKKSSVHMLDLKHNVDRELHATIKRGFFGGLRTVVIPSEEMRIVLQDMLLEQAEAVLNSFRLTTDLGELEYRLDLSDYACVAEDEALNCKFSAEIALSAHES